MRRSTADLCMILALALFMTACSGESPGNGSTTGSPSASSVPNQSPTPEVSLPAGVQPFPSHVASQSGQRYAATAFDPVFTYVGVAGMAYPFFGEDNLPRLAGWNSGEDFLTFIRPEAIYAPDGSEGSEGQVPDDLDAWLAAHPSLHVQRRGVAHLAGLDGRVIDATSTTAADPQPGYCDRDCVPLVRAGDIEIWVATNRRLRIMTFDLASGPLMVLLEASPTSFGTLAGKAHLLLDSVEFLSPQS